MPPVDLRPFLLGLFRDDPESQMPGSTVSFLFQVRDPRFFFSLAEQRVLLRATVQGSSDQEIADVLGISLDAVKQAWRSAYARVDSVDSAVLGDNIVGSTRGKEKRRQLIDYLRFHMEELRPVKRPPRGTRRSLT